jgi:hypothetical protein
LWIVENWPRFTAAGQYPGASIAELMRLVGITNPWGSHGEGITYYAHAYATINMLKDAFESGDINRVELEIQLIRNRIESK